MSRSIELSDDGRKIKCLGCGRTDFDTTVEGALRTVTLGAGPDDVVVTLITFLCGECQAVAPPEGAFVAAIQFVAAYANKGLVIE